VGDDGDVAWYRGVSQRHFAWTGHRTRGDQRRLPTRPGCARPSSTKILTGAVFRRDARRFS
jgi:hypothetical protein